MGYIGDGGSEVLLLVKGGSCCLDGLHSGITQPRHAKSVFHFHFHFLLRGYE